MRLRPGSSENGVCVGGRTERSGLERRVYRKLTEWSTAGKEILCGIQAGSGLYFRLVPDRLLPGSVLLPQRIQD